MATATASDVRVEIDTTLTDSEIDSVVSRVERDLKRELDSPPASGTDKRQDLESVLAALFIATSRDRAESSAQSGRTSVTYEDSLIEELKARAKLLGATDDLVSIGTTKPSASIGVPDARNLED